MNDYPDQLLVNNIMQGDIDCFECLCKRYYTSLQAVAYAVLMDRHLAEDAVQETFAYVCRNLLKLRKPEKVGAWLRVICRNIAIDMLKQQRKKKELSQSEAVWISKETDEIDGHIQQALSQLPVSLREVVLMRYFDEMSYQQMGNVLGLSEQAINGRLRRAKKKIEKYLIQNGFRSNIS